ncbi:SDR family NAD(P)-dependent oxidoreductase [Streptomyces iranensis]|uniref:Probable oxidoreductase n=1 Tax=Streptomyces iranensis TaxID=576784 RepID=A0A061A4R6_9ACTN|nr:SDR family NAD(P)-dependent oxidoreductase [Streptomyces iranensis]MBP2059114.1 NAD(P)-dependent dehydrogenase (short-subunit alcohol dehydrogenase family) [Streptomyces iranensis]CDR11832.1 short-chain dehydrogenase/reductase SDR [Streptomyces iranensis]
MTTKQHAIGSGFGVRSTTSDVLAGIDLSGKLALVTGGYSGLGLETTRALAGAGARVVVPARRRSTAVEALGGIGGVEVAGMDLADLDSVRAFTEEFLASSRDIDILVNNAGIMAAPETRVGPGWEAQFAINHLGHYALVNRLWPAIARGGGARVVSVSSNGHQLSDIHWDDPHFERHAYDKWQAYGQAKTANALFALHLDALGRNAGVRAFSVHPGTIATQLGRHMSPEELAELSETIEASPTNAGWKAPEEGAATQVWAATSPRLAGMGGVYCEDCDIAEPASEGTELGSGVSVWATDPERAARLWTLSAELTGVDAFTG